MREVGTVLKWIVSGVFTSSLSGEIDVIHSCKKNLFPTAKHSTQTFVGFFTAIKIRFTLS